MKKFFMLLANFWGCGYVYLRLELLADANMNGIFKIIKIPL